MRDYSIDNSEKLPSDLTDQTTLDKTIAKTSLKIQNGTKHKSWTRIAGKTTFTESRNLAQLIPCERLFLKFEGNNPTGTQKDRIAFLLAENAKIMAYTGITTATCGNFGAALAYAACTFQIPKCEIYLPKGYHVPKSRLDIIHRYNAEVRYIEGTYEDAVEYSSLIAKSNNWYDANPGSNGVSQLSLDAYAEISLEIFRELRKAPDYVLCPVGNGTTLAGIYLGFKKLFYENKIKKIPRVVACSTRRGNPIIKSYKLHSKGILVLNPEEITETKINEPLTNWKALDGQEALDAIYESQGFGEYASETQMLKFAKFLKEEEGLNVHPASASTLAVLAGITKNNVPIKGTYVAILTGRDV
ncbi:MAG: pyridoxal-phosphate dependent enzyme [Promethearchaeota archaeon]